jgi:hypothetical protein
MVLSSNSTIRRFLRELTLFYQGGSSSPLKLQDWINLRDYRHKNKLTPLLVACHEGHLEIVEVFLSL